VRGAGLWGGLVSDGGACSVGSVDSVQDCVIGRQTQGVLTPTRLLEGAALGKQRGLNEAKQQQSSRECAEHTGGVSAFSGRCTVAFTVAYPTPQPSQGLTCSVQAPVLRSASDSVVLMLFKRGFEGGEEDLIQAEAVD